MTAPTEEPTTNNVRCRNRLERPQRYDNSKPTATKQSFRDDCDVNLIVRRHAQRGMWDHLNPVTPTFGDFSEASDLQEAIQRVDDAAALFASLPARIRAHVQNDPVRFLEATAEIESLRELADLGLPVPDGVLPARQESQPAPAPAPEPPAEEGENGEGE